MAVEVEEVNIRAKTLNALIAVLEATCASPGEGIATLLFLARDMHKNYAQDPTSLFLEQAEEILRHIDMGESNGPSLADVPAGSA